MPQLRFGAKNSLNVELPSDVYVADCAAWHSTPIADVAAAVRAALNSPLDFPPLARATVPGDKIVLPLDAATPRLEAIVGAVVEALCEHGADPADIVALAEARHEQPLPAVLAGIQTLVHDPRNADQHCHLFHTDDGHDIRIHRALFDADLILPIGCLRTSSAGNYYGVHSCVFPAFADAPSRRHFLRSAAHANGHRRKLVKIVEEVAKFLGVVFTVQAVPGADGGVLDIFAGEPKSVDRDGRAQCETAWRASAVPRAELVIAAVSGGPADQTWDNVARAAAAAIPLAASDGAIAICTDLATQPGPALRRLAGADDAAAAIRHILRETSADVPAAVGLAQAAASARIYLLSGLAAETVEDLGFAPIADADELARLARRARSCAVLPSAQHVSIASGEA